MTNLDKCKQNLAKSKNFNEIVGFEKKMRISNLERCKSVLTLQILKSLRKQIFGRKSGVDTAENEPSKV